MKLRSFAGFCLTSLALAAGCTSNASEPSQADESALVGRVTEVRDFGSNPGALKMYEYVPATLMPGAPVVLVMHGCMQSASDAAQTGWNALAEEYGFLVVYPEQTTGNNGMRCFNWAGEFGDPANLQRGKGENLSLKQMVDKALASHGGDARRVFATGFSGGGAEAALAAATWPDVFAGAATFAGIPYNCTTQFLEVSGCLSPGKDRTAADWGKRVRDAHPQYAGPWPRFSIWQGLSDSTVAPANRTQLVRQWSNVHGLPTTPSTTDRVDGHAHSVWTDESGKPVMELYEIAGMGHGVPVTRGCGSTGQFAFDKGICGSRRVAEFFGIAGQK